MQLTWGAYRVAGVFPLDEIRKLTVAIYIIKNSTAANHTNTKAGLRSDKRLSFLFFRMS